MELYDPRTIRMIKREYGFRFSKKLGQNFLTDPAVTRDLVEAAGIGESDFVLEIGPGIGTLTQEAAKRAGHVTAVEVDEHLLPILAVTLADFPNTDVVQGDILEQDLAELIRRGRERLPEGSPRDSAHTKIIGNLPYYITTPILLKLLRARPEAASISVMIQKEVAERVVSPPGSRVYGALSVAVRYFSDPVYIRDVSREAFLPAPKVDSAVIRLDLRKEPPSPVQSEEIFFRCVRAAFGQRRKTLRNAMQGTGLGRGDVLACLEEAGISPDRRAETLDFSEFANLADAVFLRTGGTSGRE